jgi:thymidylate synthase
MTLVTRIPKVSTVRDWLATLYFEGTFTNGLTKTVELNGIQFLADEPAFFGRPNQEYIERELKWYLDHSLDVNKFPKPVPEIWKQVADPEGQINSNYGYLVFSEENHLQFQFAVQQLKQDPNTRRAVIQFNRPEMTKDYCKNGKNDYVCTYCYQFFIRDGFLDMLVYMRSNDAIFGYPNDFAWAQYVLGRVYTALAAEKLGKNIKCGKIIWSAGSLHVYERHFYLMDYYMATGSWDVDKKEAKAYVGKI